MILNLEHLPRVIPVGIQTESGVEAIGFDISPWLTRWPEMKISVWPTRPGESAAYIAADTEMVGNVMYWYPNTADTQKEGAGTVEVVGIGGGKRKSTGVIDTLVKKTSLDVTKETPDPFAPWYEDILKAADEVKEVAETVTGGSGLFIVTVTWKSPNRVSNKTKTEILAAVEEKKTCLLIDESNRVYTYRALRNGNPEFITTDYNNEQTNRKGITLHTAYVDDENHVKLEIRYPARTPNPYPIKLTGAVNATYDGSSAVTVEIPQGGSGGGSASKVVNILSDTTLTLADPDAGTYVLLSPFETKPEGGMLCTVNYNGVDYQCPAEVFDKGQGAVVAMGNFALVGQEGGNAEAPFVLICAPDGTEGMYAMMMVTDSPSSVTVSITAKVVDEAIRAYVDGKVGEVLGAIPEAETEVLTVTADVYNLEVSNMSHTYAEIAEAIKAGKAVQMVVNQGEDVASYALPLIMWQDSSSAQYAKFQRVFVIGESTGGKNVALTVTVNGKTGQNTAEYMELPYMTRAQVVELINEMTGGGGGDATTDVFYTADGQTFATVDAAVLHVQKGEQ